MALRFIINVLFASVRASASDGLFVALWQTGVWRLMLFLLIYSTGLATIYPITPTLMTNGFASLAAGRRMDCTLYTPATSPPECVDAHSTAAVWMSWTNFVSSSLLTFLCAPYVGHLSDRIGRKPFMLAGISLMFLPLVVIQLYLHDLLPIYWYYPASAAGGLVSSFSMALTSVADLLEQRHRATAVGYLTSCFSVGMLLGPMLGGYLTVRAALWTCMGTTAVTLAYVAAFVPECAPGPLARRRRHAASATARGADAKPASAAGTAAATAAAEEEEPAGPLFAGARGVDDGNDCGDKYGGFGDGDDDDCRTVAAAALAAAEEVSLLSAQQHLISGAAPPPAGAAESAGAEGAAAAVVLGRASPEPIDGSHPRSQRTSTCGNGSAGGAAAVTDTSRHRRSAAGTGDARSAGDDGGGSASAGVGVGEAEAPKGEAGVLAGIASGWAVIRHSSYYQRIAAIWVVVSMTWEGAGELLMQYLQLKLGFNTRDQAHVLVVLASGGLVVKLGLLALLVRWLGERRLLAFGLAAYAVECLALAVAPSKGLGLAAVSIGSLASVCWPALVALQTAGVDPRQQGAVYGALQAISSMASGLGPLVFANVFRAVSRSDSSLPPMPGVVWYMAAGLSLIAVAITLTLPQPAGTPGAGPPAGADAPGAAGSAEGGKDGSRGAEVRRVADVEAGAGEGSDEGLKEPLLRKV